MGLSIHYKGKFKKGASLTDMIDEVKDIAGINEWEYHIFEKEFLINDLSKEKFNDEIYGISFYPPKCEPIDITFLSNGKLCSPVSMVFYLKSKNKKDISPYIHTKTQYAGLQVHKIIIDLLRYLQDKFFEEFELTDESEYWETGDEIILKKNFKRYDDMMDMFSDGLENTPVKENETIEEYVTRVAKMLNYKNKK